MIWRKLVTFAGMALLLLFPGYAQAQPPHQSPMAPATQSQSPKNREAQLSQPLKSYTPQEKKAYEKKISNELNNLEQQINDLAIAASSSAPRLKRMRLRVVLAFKQQLFTAQRQLANLKRASDPNWSGLKVQMDKTMTGLRQAYKGAEARLQ
jgi:hypothetical protein